MTKILRKTCSSLVKFVPGGENNFTQNRYNKLPKISAKEQKGKGKIFYCQEPPSGESTTTECGVNYQLLAVITEVAQWGTPSCSQPQPDTDNGVRDGRSN